MFPLGMAILPVISKVILQSYTFLNFLLSSPPLPLKYELACLTQGYIPHTVPGTW